MAFRTLLVTKEADPAKRGCSDCKHLTGYVTWYCTNDEARKFAGYNIADAPAIKDCKFWSPAPHLDDLIAEWQAIPWWKRLFTGKWCKPIPGTYDVTD